MSQKGHKGRCGGISESRIKAIHKERSEGESIGESFKSEISKEHSKKSVN